jgi:predicted acyltransferase
VDFRYLPGRKNAGYYANEGLLSTLPALVTVLFGILAGNVLKAPGWSGYRKAGILALAGCAGMGLGLLWGAEFPVIKRIWTSSFCLVASGFSALMLAGFWVVVEEWKFQRWTQPFLWIGSNAITGYVLVRVVDFHALAGRFVGGDVSLALEALRPGAGVLVQALVALALPILVLRFLYQKSIFIRI